MIGVGFGTLGARALRFGDDGGVIMAGRFIVVEMGFAGTGLGSLCVGVTLGTLGGEVVGLAAVLKISASSCSALSLLLPRCGNVVAGVDVWRISIRSVAALVAASVLDINGTLVC